MKVVKRTLKILFQAAIILAAGLFLVALYWLAYLGITVLLETTIFLNNPQELRQDAVRNISALLVSVMTLIFMRLKLHETVKATLLLAGLAVFFIALILHLYMVIWLGLILVALVSGVVIWIIIKMRKSWIYYYAVGTGVLIALLYAWPR